MSSKYTKKDAAKDTGSSVKEVSKTWHQARNDAAKEKNWGVPKDRHNKDKKVSLKDAIILERGIYVPLFYFLNSFILKLMEKKKNPICTVLWYDAAYAYKKLPKSVPLPQLTTGFIVQATDDFINIATNVNYNEKTKNVYPIDGFIIPDKTIVKFKKIKNFNG